ncbi:hypothetical protein SAMN05519103_09322 [Rhizobiales bacterium GAS113]|nr:hypothetical protein SAMN05519103_09322 [Rhizobiales bacterium GAS113]
MSVRLRMVRFQRSPTQERHQPGTGPGWVSLHAAPICAIALSCYPRTISAANGAKIGHAGDFNLFEAAHFRSNLG